MKPETYKADRDAKRAARAARAKLPWDARLGQRIDPDRPRPTHNRASRRAQLGMIKPRHRNAKAVYSQHGEQIRQAITTDPLVMALRLQDQLRRFIRRAGQSPLVRPSK